MHLLQWIRVSLYGTPSVDWFNGTWDMYQAVPRFCRDECIITNLPKERERVWDRCQPKALASL